MQIQLNTDNRLLGHDDLALRLDAEVRTALARFDGRITRVEAHFNDLDGARSGAVGKRCLIEARIASGPPVAVEHRAPELLLAMRGAVEKLVRALDRRFGKRIATRRVDAKPEASPAASEPPVEPAR